MLGVRGTWDEELRNGDAGAGVAAALGAEMGEGLIRSGEFC
jgi:hypothetical protein